MDAESDKAVDKTTLAKMALTLTGKEIEVLAATHGNDSLTKLGAPHTPERS